MRKDPTEVNIGMCRQALAVIQEEVRTLQVVLGELEIAFCEMRKEPEPVMLVKPRHSPWGMLFARMPEVLEACQVARALGLKTGTFKSRWREAGFPPPIWDGMRGRGKKYYWRKTDVVQYMEVSTRDGKVPGIFPGHEKSR